MSKYPKIHQTQLFINNEFVNSLSGKTFPVMNPSTGEVIANIQEADKEDIDLAAKAARNAFQFGSSWRTMDASKRGELLYQLSDVIERDKDYIAALEMLDNGKNKQWAQWDVDFSIKQLRYCAGWADKIHGKTIPAGK